MFVVCGWVGFTCVDAILVVWLLVVAFWGWVLRLLDSFNSCGLYDWVCVVLVYF